MLLFHARAGATCQLNQNDMRRQSRNRLDMPLPERLHLPLHTRLFCDFRPVVSGAL